MISKEEYKRFIDELTREDAKKSNLKCMGSKYSSIIPLLFCIGFLICSMGVVCLPFLGVVDSIEAYGFSFAFMGIGAFVIGLGAVRLSERNRISRYYKRW